MSSALAHSLRRHAEPLVAISIAHLRPSTRRLLADGALSVLAHPNDYGGFVHVGSEGDNIAQEPELAAVFAAAQRAGIVWIKFDADAETVDGLPIFDVEEPTA